MVYVSFIHPPQSKEGVFVEGVWGPYKASNFYAFISVVSDRHAGCRIPWVVDERRWTVLYGTSVSKRVFTLAPCSTEGCPQLIDFIISTHPAHQELKDLSKSKKTNIHEGLSPLSSSLVCP